MANRKKITLNGMEGVLDLLEEKVITRAKNYNCIVLLALVPNCRPYIVLECSLQGRDELSLATAHREPSDVAKEVGLSIITLPGDGDTVLRKHQWGNYTEDRGNKWFKSLHIPITALLQQCRILLPARIPRRAPQWEER